MDAKRQKVWVLTYPWPVPDWAFGVKWQLTVKGLTKLKHINLCIGQTIIHLRVKWTIDIHYMYDVIILLQVGIANDFFSILEIIESLMERDQCSINLNPLFLMGSHGNNRLVNRGNIPVE